VIQEYMMVNLNLNTSHFYRLLCHIIRAEQNKTHLPEELIQQKKYTFSKIHHYTKLHNPTTQDINVASTATHAQ